MGLGARIGHKHLNLTIFNTTCCPTLWARHPGRMLAFFEKPHLIDDAHGLGIAQMLNHIGP